MLTLEKGLEAAALRKRGWSISAIARHRDRDRKTVRRICRANAAGSTQADRAGCVRTVRAVCTARFADAPHIQATTLYDELRELGLSVAIRRSPGCYVSASYGLAVPVRHGDESKPRLNCPGAFTQNTF
jgi:hypothetical protein